MAKNLLVSAFLLLSVFAEAGELVTPPDLEGYLSNPEASAEYASTVLHTLNELSARRRLTMLFINEQSPFYGVQMNHVNVGRGNLTFLVRDIVRLDRIPIVFGRVYDSGKQDESDFGPGWKLSVAESLRLTGRRLLYVDASNSEYELDVDGARISSVHPHLTGIRGGRFDGSGIVLEIGDLVKTFYRYGDGFRLAEVRNHSDGWISFSYSGDVIERISSSGGRHVDIQRDSTGRIVAAMDDAGRRVAYAYDSSGRLSESNDLAGEAYRYSYDAKGFLSELIDPRSERNVAARFDEVGRAIELTSQHDAMSYRYEAGSTLVTNALQQAARFWHHGTGLTQSIQDFAGGVSALELDAELHVTQFTFDGVAVARAAYAGDRLSAIIESNGSSFETRRFAYDARGRLIRIGEAGEALARYGYDERGNVTFAEDASGKRRYSYRLDGSLVGAEIDGFRLAIETNQIGLVERVRWVSGSAPSHEHGPANARNGERQEQEAVPLSLDISYNDADRVEALRFNTPTGSLASDYRYTSRGFRSGGRYDVLERIGQGEITLSYDPVGNLTEWTLPAPYRKLYTTHHTVGRRNQVSAVTPIGQEELEQTFEYDANGRPVRMVQGGRREVVLGYDELSRLTDVHLDGEHVLTARHGPMDVDPVHEADAHTPFTAVDRPVASAVFGSLEEIAFTRIEGTPHGFVRFIPTMARFIIRDPLIAPPDAVVLASLKRRNLASRATLTAEPIQGFDKPSNSLFIPPEYFAVNCWYCVAGASGFDLDRVGSGPVAVGQTVNFVADADYSVCYSYESWWPEIPEIWYYEGGWNHRILVNGTYVTQFPGPTLGWENHEYLEFGLSFPSPGQKTVTDELRCSCSNIFMAQAQTTVQVCPSSITINSPVDNPNPSDSQWTTNFTFLTADQITATASTSGDWTVNAQGPSGATSQPSGGSGSSLAFGLSFPHPTLGSGGSLAASTPLTVGITVSVCSIGDTNTIKQDTRDIIRQEYRNHAITIPVRADFNAPSPTTHFSAAQINNTAYPMVVGTPGTIAQNTRDQWNALIGQQIGSGPTNYDLIISSAWRNPERNEYFNGQLTSNHQYGTAVDLVISSIASVAAATGLTQSQLWCLLEDAGDGVGTGIPERNATQVNCTDPTITHVHVQT